MQFSRWDPELQHSWWLNIVFFDRRRLVCGTGYDGGDCCSCTCAAGDYHECGEAGFDCIDPEAPCVDLTTADPNSAAKSRTSATFIATFTAGLGVMHLVNLFS